MARVRPFDERWVGGDVEGVEHYDRFEYLCGTSGTAGNLKGQIQEGGNPFEGSRSRPYPTPAQKQPFGYTLFAKAARDGAAQRDDGKLAQDLRRFDLAL
jgi:hypothetical protein